MTWSCDQSPIHFDDIFVAVKGEEIILWSIKHDKRMVPRIPTAYNYIRSDLAVYRFLCDLQHQGIKSDLNLKIGNFFPNLLYYPRMVYKDVIISPAMWLVPHEFSQFNKIDNPLIIKLMDWLNQQKINFPFRAGDTDQTLCFNPQMGEDRKAFLLYCHKNGHKDIYISEALIANEDELTDENGKPYAGQYIVSYSHQNPVYKGYENLSYPREIKQRVNDIILPGGEWLYFEIYCHPYRSNDILLNQIAFFLKENKREIRKWFFIRYDDPKPHIRLRLQLKETAQGYLLIGGLKSLLEQDCLTGLISDIQIRTYFRETERYGANRIALVEKLFCTDSTYVLFLLAKAKTTDQLYATTMVVMLRLLALCSNSINDQVGFVKNMADNFSGELGMKQENFKKLNLSFQKFKENINSAIVPAAVRLSSRHERVFSAILGKCSDAERIKMTADLLHLHINRLFVSDQRSHEAILYHYLLKALMAQRAIAVAPAEYQVIP